MTTPTWYPGADRSQDRSRFGGIVMSRISKLVLHSTETRGWPGYPDFAPQLTYNPWTHQWRQHMPVNLSASTLRDPSSTAVKENRDQVVQVEIVGYCDPPMVRKYGRGIGQIDAQALADLGNLARWLHENYSLPLRSSVRWVNYPASYGSRASQRLSGSQYDAYEGILGHQHVSGNDHGDPGAINIAAILAAAGGADKPPTIDHRGRLNAWGFTNSNLVEAKKDWQQWLWNYADRAKCDGNLGPREVSYLTGDDSKFGTAPVKGVDLNYLYGTPNFRYQAGIHTGDDWAAPIGTPVYCTRSGTVVTENLGSDYGNVVTVRTPEGVTVAYCHLSRKSVSVGQRVKFGQKIGEVGATGNVTGPHLHYEECVGTWRYNSGRTPVWDRSPAKPY